MKNILSFDVEEWCDTFCLADGELDRLRQMRRAEIGVKNILGLLRPKKIKATFFVVAKLAEENAGLVKMIDAEGHEVASHSYAHKPVSSMTPAEFKEDLLRSMDVLKGITGKEVVGYRAPGYTITRETLWALRVIKECGLQYDSSIYPVSVRLFTRGGAGGFPQGSFVVEGGLQEIPLITASLFGLKVPVATTSYFRIFPYAVTKWSINRLNRKGIAAALNFHSWEFDADQPRIKLPFPHNIKHYYNLDKTERRFKDLINDFNFVNCREVVRG